MPNRYEREIEEILRNMERTEPRQGFGNRIRAFNRTRGRSRSGMRLSLNRMEVLVLIGIALALAGTGVAYYQQAPVLVSGVLALLGFAFVVIGLVLAWSMRFRGPSVSPGWRGNVVDMRPRRRNPFSIIATRFRILRLKLRYSRRNDTP